MIVFTANANRVSRLVSTTEIYRRLWRPRRSLRKGIGYSAIVSMAEELFNHISKQIL